MIHEVLPVGQLGCNCSILGDPDTAEAIVIDPAVLFTASGKRLLGCLLGSVNSRREVPRLLDLWRRGLLDLESMITMRGDLADIDRAFEDLAAGRGIRTVLAI